MYSVYGCNDQLPSCVGVYQPNVLTANFSSGPLINGVQWVLPTFDAANMGTYWLGVWTSVRVNLTILASQRFATSAIKLSDGGKLLGQSVSSIADPEYYYAQLPPYTIASVVVDVCYGQGQVLVSDSVQYPYLTSDATTISNLSLTSQPILSYNDPVTGNVYLAVMPLVEGFPLLFQVAVYGWITPSPYLTPSFSWFNPGVTVTAAAGGFDVTWKPATPVGSTKLRYLVYYTTVDDPTNVQSVCGGALIRFSLTSGVYAVNQPNSILQSNLVSVSVRGLPLRTYKVGVVAGVAPSNLFASPINVTYPLPSSSTPLTVSVTSSSSSGYSSATLAAIAIPIVLIVVGALAYLCYRSTRLQAQLTGIDIRDVPRQQVLKAMEGVRFKRRGRGGRGRQSSGGGGRYNKLGYRLEDEGTEMSVSELGLDEEGGQDGEHMDGGLFGDGEEGEEQRTYTLDAVLEHIGEDEEKEDSLTFD